MIRVLLVDDSAVVCTMLREALAPYADIDVIGSAVDPYSARDMIAEHQPDVVTLDLDMPRMDGLTFLARLMKHYPLPVVVLSAFTLQHSAAAIEALTLGAVEVLCKPGSPDAIPAMVQQLVRAIRIAAGAHVSQRQEVATSLVTAPTMLLTPPHPPYQVLAIGASTGGTLAIETILRGLPTTVPGIVIVQHLPEPFTASFATRLNHICQVEVREARDGDRLVAGLALIAPGNQHMLLQQHGTTYLVRLKHGPLVHHQRPSVEVLFHSVARSAGRHAIGVLLTGMGSDGATGLLAMHDRGAYTLAQDEHTCVIFGMPKAALALGAVDAVVPLPQMAQKILHALTTRQPVTRTAENGEEAQKYAIPGQHVAAQNTDEERCQPSGCTTVRCKPPPLPRGRYA